MRKLTLKLDDLAVNSFEPLPREESDRGTVLGQAATGICIVTPVPASTNCLTQTSPPTTDCFTQVPLTVLC